MDQLFLVFWRVYHSVIKCDVHLMKRVSRPQQLSTYALTLYKYTTTINGKTILVGKYESKVMHIKYENCV